MEIFNEIREVLTRPFQPKDQRTYYQWCNLLEKAVLKPAKPVEVEDLRNLSELIDIVHDAYDYRPEIPLKARKPLFYTINHLVHIWLKQIELKPYNLLEDTPFDGMYLKYFTDDQFEYPSHHFWKLTEYLMLTYSPTEEHYDTHLSRVLPPRQDRYADAWYKYMIFILSLQERYPDYHLLSRYVHKRIQKLSERFLAYYLNQGGDERVERFTARFISDNPMVDKLVLELPLIRLHRVEIEQPKEVIPAFLADYKMKEDTLENKRKAKIVYRKPVRNIQCSYPAFLTEPNQDLSPTPRKRLSLKRTSKI